MESRVQLVFYGEVIQGFKPSDVRDDLGDLLEIDEASRTALFSGARIVLKDSMDFFEAQGYEERLRDLGAYVHVEPDDDDAPPAATADAAPAVRPPDALAKPQLGPPAAPLPVAPAAVALPAVEEQVTCPNCNERQPKRVMCRACGSDIAMALAYKRESETEQRVQRLARARARRGLPGLPGDGGGAADAPSVWGLGMNGRLARLPFVTAFALAVMAVNLLLVYAIPHPSVFKLNLLIFGTVLLIVFAVRLSVLRAHDFNGSGLWAALLFVPYLGVVALLALAALPGSFEENDHGGRPRPGHPLLSALSVVLMTVTLVATYRWIASMVDEVLPAGGPALAIPSQAQIEARLPSPEAMTAFRDEFVSAPVHKAFAASPTGSWGWKSGAASAESAAAGALESCDTQRKAYTRPCELVNVNGGWVSR
ncbi:MAG: DUF805 domain-containing protein [Burkholderiaceae bacterium]